LRVVIDHIDTRRDEVGSRQCAILLYQDLAHIKALKMVDPSAAEAIVDNLEGRIRLYLARLIDSTKVDLNAKPLLEITLVALVPGGPALLPRLML
jgi:hypothetical protein